MAKHGGAVRITARSAQALDEALGRVLRARRIELNLTQQTLADRCAVSFQQIQKYENGANRISFARLVEMATALDTTVSDLARAVEPTKAAKTAPAVLHQLEMLTAPGALEMLETFNGLSPEVRRMLLGLLRELRQSAHSP